MQMFSDEADETMNDSSNEQDDSGSSAVDFTQISNSLLQAGIMAQSAIAQPGMTVIQPTPAAAAKVPVAAVATKATSQTMMLIILALGGFMLYSMTAKK